MKAAAIASLLWGQRARFSYLFIAAILLLTTFLSAREIWTQEHRWADIVSGMFFRHDFLHPYLGESTYYDKPLLSYWLIVFAAKLFAGLTPFTLRLPSVAAGLLAIWSIYSLGCQLYAESPNNKNSVIIDGVFNRNKQFGLLCGWLLLTTFYFLFWARTSSADMLNLAGSLFAVSWYFAKKNTLSFFNYFVFFLILALTSLCKGLVGAVIPIMAVFVDIVLHRSLKLHWRWSLFLAAIPALLIYMLPFVASNYFGGDTYQQNGLYQVYRENVLRYFQPYDHKGPIYTYLIYLPIYLLPWTIFLLPALWTLKKRWPKMRIQSKWIVWTLLGIFLFFSLSGSRRSYYVLPMLPFAILLVSDWLFPYIMSSTKRSRQLAVCVLSFFLLLFFMVDVLPAWYYSQVGVNRFALLLQEEANKIKPWSTWQVVLLDSESKLNFYLQLPPNTPRYYMKGETRKAQTTETLLQAWPIIKNKPAHTIFISRKFYFSLLQPYFHGYRVIELPQPVPRFLQKQEMNQPIAWLPPDDLKQ